MTEREMAQKATSALKAFCGADGRDIAVSVAPPPRDGGDVWESGEFYEGCAAGAVDAAVRFHAAIVARAVLERKLTRGGAAVTHTSQGPYISVWAAA